MTNFGGMVLEYLLKLKMYILFDPGNSSEGILFYKYIPPLRKDWGPYICILVLSEISPI